MPLSRERKEEFFERLKGLLTTYSKCFVVGVDNVGSKQLQNTRIALRGKAEVLMGKNTMMRKVFAEFIEENPDTQVGQLIPELVGNVGFVFTNGDLGKIKETIAENKRPAPAKVGAIAPIDVIVPPGPTGCDPGQTAFFQTLQIPTKITKGQIEMTGITHLIKAGEKVGASQAALLAKLDINPFSYGLLLVKVYDNGSCFDAKVLDITDEVLSGMFSAALKVVASASLALNYPTQASVPHSIANAFKATLAILIGLPTFDFEKGAPYKALYKL
jgi:large subunit ribosomal protein LP0